MKSSKISRKKVINAIKLITTWIGDDPARVELIETPMRILEVLGGLFAGYAINPKSLLEETLEEVKEYNEIILLKNLRFTSYCEHHLMPFAGKCHIGYIPDRKIAGIGKLVKVVEAYAKRLQIQERLTVEIASVIYEVLKPKGVGVVMEASHNCLLLKNPSHSGAHMVTSKMFGSFNEDAGIRQEFINAVK